MAKSNTDNAEDLIKRFGEEYRKLIESSIKWLDEEEPKWGLQQRIGRVSFIKGLISKAKK